LAEPADGRSTAWIELIPTGLRRERSAERRNGEYISVMTQRITPIE
jgi:hypothetical protein